MQEEIHDLPTAYTPNKIVNDFNKDFYENIKTIKELLPDVKGIPNYINKSIDDHVDVDDKDNRLLLEELDRHVRTTSKHKSLILILTLILVKKYWEKHIVE